jgi:hypothetical protein
MSDNKVGHVSASSIAAFKTCPTKYRIAYVEAIRPERDAEPLRMGTAWHRGLEVLESPTGTEWTEHIQDEQGQDVYLTINDENRLMIAIAHATAIYNTVPDWADPTDWAVEREVIANALAGYAWLYPAGMSEYETVATELEFELPLRNPETGHSTPNFVRAGKIDRIIRSKATGAILIQENKTTGKPIDSGSTYWQRLRKDTQSKFYIQAARDLAGDGIRSDLLGVSGLLHDVFHKPTIKPSKLTQGESAEFMRTGDYCGQHFEVQALPLGANESGAIVVPPRVLVDDVVAEVELGAEPKPTKKDPNPAQKFAIRETPAMYGARLLQDITQRPEFYFARREIAFTDQELKAFEYQVWSLQKMMNEMERTGYWFESEQQCEATYKCPYCVLCYQNVDVYHGQTPPGFKRLHVEEAEQTEATAE